MIDAATIQALGLSVMTVAFPFHNWLVMLDAVAAQEEARRERWQRDSQRRRALIEETVSGFGFIGLAKPQTIEQAAAGAFVPGF